MLDFRTDKFLTVCETLIFTVEARRLHITQPAVSQHIRFLEKEYNTRLFSYCNKQKAMLRKMTSPHCVKKPKVSPVSPPNTPRR